VNDISGKKIFIICALISAFVIVDHVCAKESQAGFLNTDGQSQAHQTEAKAAGLFEEFVCDMNFFKANVPTDWARHEEITQGRIAKAYGVDLRGPQNKDGAFSRISITYYGPDHRRFRSAEKFLELNATMTVVMLHVEGETIGPVSEVSVAGMTASQFDRRVFLFIPPYSVKSKKIPMFERLIVLKGKEGFYVLEYSSPEDVANKHIKVFEQVVASFKPNV